ncbi:MAG: rRNA maturation RNase YbeY [Muribaculaceae bacterium]
MINSFQWLSRGVEMPGIDYAQIERWIIRVAREHNRIVGEVAYIFCDDEEILRVNRQFLQHDYYTDIITFDNTRGRLIGGDIFVSLDTVASNAEAVGTTYDSELRRVIIHGILHLCGINDKGPGEREVMEAHEDAALQIIDSL